LDDLADGVAFSKTLQLDLKHLLPAASLDSSIDFIERIALDRHRKSTAPDAPTVPLNLRHCVFLI
jgi:hypothetical protein